MIRLRKHIAFLLFGIFFFPVIFQSLHIVWHHSHGYECEHHHCHKESPDKNSALNTQNLSDTENTCLICEFEFSITDVPELFIKKKEIPVLTYTYSEVATQQQYKQIFTDKTPRAPPILVS